MDSPNCPICNGESSLLGILGNLGHYVCRDCGMQFSAEVEKEEKEKEDKEN